VTRALDAAAVHSRTPDGAADLTVRARAGSLPPMLRRLAAFAVLTTILWLPTVTPPPVARAATCTGWTSTRVPPTTIRVLRTSTGRVQTVNFRTYVERVLSVEWPPNWPATALQVGAIAVKQYGWYYTMSYRGGTAHGSCYDVVDNTNDQIYRDVTPAAVFVQAVDATWDISITRSGSFPLTGYRSGASVACGMDADQYHLFQHSSYYCAVDGLSVDEILTVYYGGPAVEVWRAPPRPASVALSPPMQGQGTVGATATISWSEEPAAGKTIAARQVSLLMATPRNGSCSVDRWLPASPAWQSTDASPQTVTGLIAGACYRVVVELVDSDGATSLIQSGAMLSDPTAPDAAFTSPSPNVVTSITGSSVSVAWTETAVPGASIASRKLTTERAAQPVGGTCAGALWKSISSTTSRSPVTSSGLTKLFCYRYRLELTDSAGRTSTHYSGVVITPSA
jgi:hypothetical protein